MAAHQAPLSLGFSRQEPWSGLPFPSPIHESEKWKWSRSVVSDSSDPMDCSPPGSCVHGIFQAKVLEWGAIAFSNWSFISAWQLDEQNQGFIKYITPFRGAVILVDVFLVLYVKSWRQWALLATVIQRCLLSHPEPDILEWEVKWALGSITKNKASRSDRIPVELFQILKDDAVKVLHSICQQIWKTQQWPQDWKRSLFISIPKAMPKNVQIIAQFSSVAQSCPALYDPMNHSTPGLLSINTFHSFHMLAK